MRLYIRSFIEGAGSILNLGGNLPNLYQFYKKGLTPEQQDSDAILKDWISVGNDLEEAIKKLNIPKIDD